MQYFELRLDTQAPQLTSIDTLEFYKDNSKSITITANGASFMKVWFDQKAEGTTEDEALVNWEAYSSSKLTNFVNEGTNYVHIVLMDEVGNILQEDGHDKIYNSNAMIFDKTAPTISAVSIASGADIVSNRTVSVRVSASDAKTGIDVSGILKSVLSGDLDESSDTTFTWTDTDRTNGYKDCVVILSNNTGTRETKTVNAIVYDRAENESSRVSDNIVLYTGGIDPVMIAKDGDTVIGSHYGKNLFDLVLSIINGDESLISGYKIFGDFNTTEGTEPTPEPTDWTSWGTGTSKTIEDLYLTQADGNKDIKGSARFIVSSIAGTVATKSALPTSADEGDIYKVSADETHEGETTAYRFVSGAFTFYGFLEDGDAYAWHYLETITIHHSEAQPSIVLTTDKSIISDKEDHNVATLTATMTTSCDVNEYKVVAYASQEDAQDGTYEDASNVGLTGYTPIESGEAWEPELEEDKLVLAISGEGTKYVVVYAKNQCDKWGKSNILSIKVDLTAPTGSITVNQYYKEASGFTSSATDSGSSVAKMSAWVDNAQASETAPSGTVEYDYAPNITVEKVNWTNVNEGTAYAHIKFVDEVGNASITHSVAFIFDETAPTGASITLPSETNTPNIVASLSALDSVSGLDKVKVFGDVSGAATEEQATWVDYTTSLNITLTNGDGTKTVKALFKDKAGNITATAVSATTTLDTSAPSATLQLWNNTDTAQLSTKTNVREFYAHIGSNDALDIDNIAQYKIWGGITEASTEEDAEWKTFVKATGKQYMSVAQTLTSGDGVKSVNVKVKDKAGNVSVVATQTITLDTSKPVITVSGVDYNIISDKNVARRSASGEEITGTKCNKMTFKFSCDQKLVEYKVCVNDEGQTAEGATAIGMTHGSINMSGTIVAASTEVACTIMEGDFSATDKVDDTDGVYEVIIYGKNEAGTWSATHVIA